MTVSDLAALAAALADLLKEERAANSSPDGG